MFSTKEEILIAIQNAATWAEGQAVEEEFLFHEIKGTDGSGYYFMATDRAPKEGEFKYMTQGTLCVGELQLAFTILTNEGQDDVIALAVSMLRGSVYTKD